MLRISLDPGFGNVKVATVSAQSAQVAVVPLYI
jgi:hypothetical protein